MTEEGHEGLERHPGIHHGGGESMTELVRLHVADAGRFGGPIRVQGAEPAGRDRRPWCVKRNCDRASRPSGDGSGRPSERVRQIRSIRATVSSSRGTIRSVASLPSGTLSHAPLPGNLVHASSSRSSSSPMRSPQARAKNRASAR